MVVTGPGRTSRVELVFLTRLLIVASKGIQKFFHVDSRIVGFGIRNPRSTDRGPGSSSWNPESTAWSPQSKTVLDSLTWGENKSGGVGQRIQFVVMKVGMSNFHCENHKRYHLYHVISNDILIVIRYCGF